MKNPLITIKNLCKSYDEPNNIEILNDISLDIYSQDQIMITGASGSGKSTLLKILGTLDSPTSGSVSFSTDTFKSQSLSQLRQKHIGFLFQDPLFIDDENVLFNVLLPATIAHLPTHKNSKHYKRAIDLLETLSLKNRIHHPIRLLSGGEQVRVGIARALLMQPKILFADEPTGSLDPQSSKQVESLLFSFTESEQLTLIIVTHDHQLAKQGNRWFTIKNKQLSLCD